MVSLGGAVPARPWLETNQVQTLILKKDNIAFNLNLVYELAPVHLGKMDDFHRRMTALVDKQSDKQSGVLRGKVVQVDITGYSKG